MTDPYSVNVETNSLPTYEEIVLFAASKNLLSKVNTRKFFDYYEKQKFEYKGLPMDWKTKMFQWASKQRGSVPVTEAEKAIVAALGTMEKKEEARSKYDPVRLQKLIDMI